MAIYENLGIRFMYPENWQVSREQASTPPYEVLLQTPGGGFWSVHVYGEESEPADLVSETVRLMRKEYPDLDAEEVSEPIGAYTAVGQEMNFYCLDLVVTARVLSYQGAGRTMLVFYQAENSEFDQLGRVFEAITVSLERESLESPE